MVPESLSDFLNKFFSITLLILCRVLKSMNLCIYEDMERSLKASPITEKYEAMTDFCQSFRDFPWKILKWR